MICIFLFLFVLLVMQFGKMFFKTDKSLAMCGIFAFSGVKNLTEDQLKIAVNKIKILGLYNQTRGVHGCGMFIDNKIVKGVDKTKLYENYIQEHIFSHNSKNHIIIGHDRQVSRGGHTEEFTHPFLIDDDLVGVHNGTIENIYDLFDKSGVKREKEYSDSDSRALFRIIHRVPGYKVLNEYKGGAALLWTKLSEPNSLYIYHGASKVSSAENAEEKEERPLFYMQTPEGYYFSSLQEALLAIRDEADQEVKVVEHNRVFKLTNGRFTKIREFIDRGDANIPAVYVAPSNKHNHHFHDRTNSDYGSRIENSYKEAMNKNSGGGLVVEPMIWREICPEFSEETPFIYFHRGRYYHTDTRLLCDGLICIDKKKRKIIKFEDADVAEKHYFFKGVMMNSIITYEKLLKAIDEKEFDPTDTKRNFAIYVSKFSRYAVANLFSEAKDIIPELRYLWYESGVRAKEGFTPKFGGRNYKINNGVLVEITSANRADKNLIYDTYEEANVAWVKSLGQAVNENTKVSVVKELPFPNQSGNSTSDLKQQEAAEGEDSIFFNPFLDTVYGCLEDFLRDVKPYVMRALKGYVAQEIRTTTNIPADEKEIETTTMLYIHEAIDHQKTLRMVLDCMNDTGIDLLMQIEKSADTPIIIEFPKKDDPTVIDAEYTPILDESIGKVLETMEQEDENELVHERDRHSSIPQEIDEELDEAMRIQEDAENDIVNLMEGLADLRDHASKLEISESSVAKSVGDIALRAIDNIKHNVTDEIDGKVTKLLVNKINNIL